MQNHIIEIILGLVVLYLLFKQYFPVLFQKQRDAGAQFATTHIFRQIKKAGFINIILDGEKMTVIEAPKDKKKK